MNPFKSFPVVLGVALLFGSIAALGAVPDAGPCGRAPPLKPARASAAEGIPPLPLPAQPLRRTEKKKPPRPPVVVVKIKTGTRLDWGTDPNDVNNLLIWMKSNLGVNFTYEKRRLGQINLEAGNVPVLYRSGHHAFSFSPAQRRQLRQYLLGGGMMIFDACCGRQEFAESARREIKAILPEYRLKPISPDHPIFNCYYQNAGWVRFTRHSLKQDSSLRSRGPSGIEGVEIACRMAVVFSPHDLSCGWDMHTHTTDGSTYIQSEDALKIGANLIAYATATKNMGISLAQAKTYVDAGPSKTDKFCVGQLVHEGDWNPDPVGLLNLLDTLGQTTAVKISFTVEPTQPVAKQLGRYPFVYMTGHDDFTWNQAQVAAIRQYLHNGGFLFAEACCGRKKFDLAFRREIAKVLGPQTDNSASLQILPLNHPIYSIYHNIQKVQLTQAANFRSLGGLANSPKLEGAVVNRRLAVVYSPLALNVGWRVRSIPYAVGYSSKSSLELGINTVMYALAE